jgi:protease PrsW
VNSNLLFAIAGAIPALVAMWWIDRLDSSRPEPAKLGRKAAFFGMLVVIPAVIIELAIGSAFKGSVANNSVAGAAIKAFLIAATVEELCKYAAMRLAVWKHPAFDERMDGIVYASRAALGFALIENMLYMLGQHEWKSALLVWLLRACLSVPGHMIWSGIVGAMAARRRFDGRGVGLLGGLIIAIALHGLFDFAIFAMQPLHAEYGDAVLAIFAVPVLLTLVGYKYFRRLQLRALADDNRDPRLAKPPAATA